MHNEECQELRTILRAPPSLGLQSRSHKREVILPHPATSWQLSYSFLVPPHPSEALLPTIFDPLMETIYVWGDLSFDMYNGNSDFPVSANLMNQLVPQVMTGRVPSSNQPGSFEPLWTTECGWVMQAQYFWLDEEGRPRASCGEKLAVVSGERIDSLFSYNAALGTLTLQITATASADDASVAQRTNSKLVVSRPFPRSSSKENSFKRSSTKDGTKDPTVSTDSSGIHCGTARQSFKDWREFFECARQASGTHGALARPSMCVEYKGEACSVSTLKTVSPFHVKAIRMWIGAELGKEDTEGMTDRADRGHGGTEYAELSRLQLWRASLFSHELGECDSMPLQEAAADGKAGLAGVGGCVGAMVRCRRCRMRGRDRCFTAKQAAFLNLDAS